MSGVSGVEVPESASLRVQVRVYAAAAAARPGTGRGRGDVGVGGEPARPEAPAADQRNAAVPLPHWEGEGNHDVGREKAITMLGV